MFVIWFYSVLLFHIYIYIFVIYVHSWSELYGDREMSLIYTGAGNLTAVRYGYHSNEAMYQTSYLPQPSDTISVIISWCGSIITDS